MAKCGHCNHIGTKLTEISPSGAKYKMMAVCCSACSSILGVTDYLNTGVLIRNLEKKVEALTSEVDDQGTALQQIRSILTRR